jgi:hypothetical protein
MGNMNITFAQYVLGSIPDTIACIQVTIDGQEMSVPLDPANRHYAEILRQVESGTLVVSAAE